MTSLRSCKRVCKLWYAMINDLSFAHKQLRFHVDNTKYSVPVSLLLNWIPDVDDEFNDINHSEDLDRSTNVLALVTFTTKKDSEGDEVKCRVKKINLPPVAKAEEADYPEILQSAHCDSIICLFDPHYLSGHTIVFCNPSLGEVKILCTRSLCPEFVVSGSGFVL